MKTVKEEFTTQQKEYVSKQMKSFEDSIALLSGSKLLKYCVEVFGVKCLNEDGKEYSPKSKSSILPALRQIALNHYTAEAIELSMMEEVDVELESSFQIALNKRDTFLGVPTNVDIKDLGIYVTAIDQSQIVEEIALGIHLVERLNDDGSVQTVTGGSFSRNFFRIATEEEVYQENTPMSNDFKLGGEHSVNRKDVRPSSFPPKPQKLKTVEDSGSVVVCIAYSNKADLVKQVYKLTGIKIHANCFTWKSTLEARANIALSQAGIKGKIYR